MRNEVLIFVIYYQEKGSATTIAIAVLFVFTVVRICNNTVTFFIFIFVSPLLGRALAIAMSKGTEVRI